jgi:hypothetical protein
MIGASIIPGSAVTQLISTITGLVKDNLLVILLVLGFTLVMSFLMAVLDISTRAERAEATRWWNLWGRNYFK